MVSPKVGDLMVPACESHLHPDTLLEVMRCQLSGAESLNPQEIKHVIPKHTRARIFPEQEAS